jgi:uncharacterized protein YceK
MKWMRAALLAAAVAVPSSGCGTVFNLASRSPDNYGGVQRDLKFAADASANGGLLSGGDFSPGGSAEGNPAAGLFALAALALYGTDLSLSFVADTLTLPLATYLRQKHEGSTDNTAAPAN